MDLEAFFKAAKQYSIAAEELDASLSSLKFRATEGRDQWERLNVLLSVLSQDTTMVGAFNFLYRFRESLMEEYHENAIWWNERYDQARKEFLERQAQEKEDKEKRKVQRAQRKEALAKGLCPFDNETKMVGSFCPKCGVKHR